MDVFVARQPIFNKKQEVIAYELLYRSGEKNAAGVIDGNQATSAVLTDSLMALGIENLVDKKLAFVNFTEHLIKEEIPLLFNNKQLVVEILEDVEPDERIIEACTTFKERGFIVALDDFVFGEGYQELAELADIIKVDFMFNDLEKRKAIVDQFKDGKKKFLAEKVETQEEFEQALDMGYDYFQGYFFSKPVIMKGKSISASPLYTTLLKELEVQEPEIDKIAKTIENDVSITYKILKLINSPAYYKRNQIKSIKQALAYIGVVELKKWITLLMLKEFVADKPDELIKMALVRAKFMEDISKKMKGVSPNSAFMVGLFSMIDTMMSKPLIEIIDEMPLEDAVVDALLGIPGNLTNLLNVIKCYESGNWESLFEKAEAIDISQDIIVEVYINALSFSNEVYSSSS